ncbi:MAG TPA: biopolymer transporter ExbD, partial [Thermoanaerobaculia bacterium]|nr:biopolymer transporter ExbD [Thermoanaerobaculia bacterium]
PGVLALEEPQLPVEILADGSLTVDGEPVEPADLHRVLGEIWTITPNRPVIVKGDRRVRYAQVRWVLQSVNAAGFRRAGLTADRR